MLPGAATVWHRLVKIIPVKALIDAGDIAHTTLIVMSQCTQDRCRLKSQLIRTRLHDLHKVYKGTGCGRRYT